MHRLWLILVSLILVLAIMPLTACDDNGNEENEVPEQIVSLTPSNEESAMPERIVSLAPSNTEILFALGLGDKVVGVTEYCDYPPEALEKPKVGGFSTVDIEKVLSLSPDLILAANLHIETVVPELERRGLRVVTLNPTTTEEVLDGITQLGVLTGNEVEASQIVNDMRERIEAVVKKTASLSEDEKPRFLALAWHDPIYAASPANLQGQLIAMAGGTNIAYDITSEPMGLEAVIARNPQVIIAYTGHGDGRDLPFNWAKTEPRLKNTEAVKNNRVYQIDTNVIGRAGPRIADALEQIAQFLHPEIFGSPKTEVSP
jgi:iron complex transport system substrate-binding protein